MADDDEYVEGNSESEPADAPGAVPADDKPAAVQDAFDSSSTTDAPVQKILAHRNAAQKAASRKAFAEAVIAAKKQPTAAKPDDPEDPEDEALAAADANKPAAAELAAAKAAAADPKPVEAHVPAPPVAAPPAPSLDPEVRKLKEQYAAELAELQKQRAELDKAKAAPEPVASDALSLEDYIDAPHRSYRNWLETMRGEKFSDEDFKSEVADFITLMSAEVLGVPLPENTRTKLDAALARKAVRTNKVIQAKKEAALTAKLEKERAAAAEKAETERIEAEWTKAASVLGQQFSPVQNAEGKPEPSAAAKAYPWLAAEDEPGKVVVDVIRAAANKDGTQLSWQEASKRADDYLKAQYKAALEKRKALLQPEPAATPVVAKPKPAAPAEPVAPPPEARVVSPSKPWSKDRHMESTKAAFRAALAGKTPA